MKQAIEIFFEIFSVSTIRYFVIAGIAYIVCYKLLNNWLSNSKIQSKSAAKRDFIREIVHSLKTTAVFAVIGYVVLYTPFRDMTRIYASVSDYPAWWIAVSLILAFIIHDTYFYWMHRLLHHKKLFRHAHLVHHQSTNPSPWSSYSFHFIEAWTEGAILFIIVMVIPVHPITIVLFTVGGFIINVYGHLGYEVAPKQFRKTFLFEILNSSVYHNLHHSKFKGNYGLYFRIWDRLLKTEHPDYVKEYDRIQRNRFAPRNEPIIRKI